MKNYGFQPIELKDTDFMFGAVDGISYNINNPGMDWRDYYSRGELQYGNFDTMACVSFSANKILEALFNYQYQNMIISPRNINWLETKGYIVDGKFNFSDRFTAKMSGTTKDGNNGSKVADSIRHNGLVPEAKWAFNRQTFDWDDYYQEVPNEVWGLGQEFARKFDILYNFVSANEVLMKEALVHGPVQAYVHAWDNPSAGVYQKTDKPINHSISVQKPQWTIFDHYIDPVDNNYDKQLVPDFNFYPTAILYVVKEKWPKAYIVKDKKSAAVGVLQIPNNPAELVRLAKEAGINNISEPIKWKEVIGGTYQLN